MTSAIIMTRSIEEIGLNDLTEDSSPDPTADYTITYDASAATNKKVLLDNLGLGRKYKITTGDYTNSSTVTPTAITDLDFTVKANLTYRAIWYLATTASVTTIGPGLRLTSSAGTLSSSSALSLKALSTHTVTSSNIQMYSDETNFSSTYSTTVKGLTTKEVFFICSADATISLGFLCSAAGTTTVFQYSCVEYQQFGSYNV